MIPEVSPTFILMMAIPAVRVLDVPALKSSSQYPMFVALPTNLVEVQIVLAAWPCALTLQQRDQSNPPFGHPHQGWKTFAPPSSLVLELAWVWPPAWTQDPAVEANLEAFLQGDPVSGATSLQISG